jgi:membrane protease subunit (stomatin/prohibitin family)
MTYYISNTDNRVYEFSGTPSGNDWEQVSAAKGKQLQQEQARDRLRELFAQSEDKRVYSILRHVSASGMSRRIDFYCIRDNRPVWLSYDIARALDYKQSDKGGLVVGGCGMDMGFHVVYTLSSVLYGHTNDGGYILKQEWI